MLELVVSVCLLANPSQCKEVSLVYLAEGTTPMQCMMASPTEIARWSESHPKWFARKWACRPAGHMAKI